MSRNGKKQNAARNGGICGRSIRLIFACFGQQLYELCRGVHRDRRFAVILRVPRHDAVRAGVSSSPNNAQSFVRTSQVALSLCVCRCVK